MTTYAPFTGEPLADLPVSTPHDVERAYAVARAAQQAWAGAPLADRARVLLRLHDLRARPPGRGARPGAARDRQGARGTPSRSWPTSRSHARHYARRRRATCAGRHAGLVPVLSPAHELRHPKGVVGIVSPWNYPLTLARQRRDPGLRRGQRRRAQARHPDRADRAVGPGAGRRGRAARGPVAGRARRRADGRSARSSTAATSSASPARPGSAARWPSAAAAGWSAARSSSAARTRCSCSTTPTSTARPRARCATASAAPASCASRWSGSTSSSAVHDAFLDRFLRRVRALRLGRRARLRSDMGSLLSAAQLDRVTAHVDDAVAKGATVLAGGRARPDLGPFFYEPTVLAGRHRGHGPVPRRRPSARSWRSARCADEDEAVALANDSAYGLNASVWTRDVARGRRVAARIETGTVSVNETYGAAWGATRSPMGGVKDSGLGRRHGREGILKYTEPQTVAVQRLAGFGPPPSVSWDQWAEGFTAVAASRSRPSAADDPRRQAGGPLRRRGRGVGVRRVGRRRCGWPRRATGCWCSRPAGGSPTTSSPARRGTCAASCGRRGSAATASSGSTGCPDVTVLAGAGVGGGSLVYANTLYAPGRGVLRRPAVARRRRLAHRARPGVRPGEPDARRHAEPDDDPGRRRAAAGRRRDGRRPHLHAHPGRRCSSATRRVAPSTTRTSAAPARPAPAASSAASA